MTLVRSSFACVLLAGAAAHAAASTSSASVAIRGQAQALHLYGAHAGRCAIVASGDGGWIHVGPEVAEFLADQGYFVVGFDSRAYLSSFTEGAKTLRSEDVPGDFGVLLDYLARSGGDKPLLIGVSEGAALAVVAAADERVKARIGGVICLGLPDQAELGWRLRDSVIYVTKGLPKEPLFSTAEFVGKIAPRPLAVIQSTHDEFVPRADLERVMARAAQPKQLWMIEAANHRFGGKSAELQARLLGAISWMAAQPH